MQDTEVVPTSPIILVSPPKPKETPHRDDHRSESHGSTEAPRSEESLHVDSQGEDETSCVPASEPVVPAESIEELATEKVLDTLSFPSTDFSVATKRAHGVYRRATMPVLKPLSQFSSTTRTGEMSSQPFRRRSTPWGFSEMDEPERILDRLPVLSAEDVVDEETRKVPYAALLESNGTLPEDEEVDYEQPLMAGNSDSGTARNGGEVALVEETPRDTPIIDEPSGIFCRFRKGQWLWPFC